MTTVQRAYKYRFYPTSGQAEQLARTFGCARYVYSHFLRLRTDAKNILKAGKAILAGADKLREHEQKTTAGRAGG